MNKYEIILHRVVEHDTIYHVIANNEDEAIDYVLSGEYDDVVSDSEIGEIEDPEVIDIREI